MSYLRALGRHKALVAVGAAVAAPLAAWAGFSAVSHVAFGRSNMSTASEMYFRLTDQRKKLADPLAFDNYVLDQSVSNELPASEPDLITMRSSVEATTIANTQTFLLNRRDRNDRAVIYLHGGIFLRRPTLYQWKFADTIARRTRAEVFVPLYPLAPVHAHAEAHEAVEGVYRSVVEEYGARNVTLMGDGAGAGLAASFAQRLDELGLERPAHLILVSPWVDVTLSNPRVADYEANDPMLASYGMRKAGALWARGADPTSPIVSPINGEVRCLHNVMVFAGTRELLYPDARLLYDRIAATGNQAQFMEGRGLNHNYPLYPTPEASRAITAIVQAVTED